MEDNFRDLLLIEQDNLKPFNTIEFKGILYCASTSQILIIKEGKIIEYFGKEQFKGAEGICFRKDEFMIVSDRIENKLFVISPQKQISPFCPDKKWNNPRGIAITETGEIFVCNSGEHQIWKISNGGEVTLFAGSTPGNTDGKGVNARFFVPCGLQIFKKFLYVTDSGNGSIRKINIKTAEVKTFFGGLNRPFGIAIDSQGNIFVTEDNKENGKIEVKLVSPKETKLIKSFGIAGDCSLSINGNGNLIFSNSINLVEEVKIPLEMKTKQSSIEFIKLPEITLQKNKQRSTIGVFSQPQSKDDQIRNLQKQLELKEKENQKLLETIKELEEKLQTMMNFQNQKTEVIKKGMEESNKQDLHSNEDKDLKKKGKF